MHVTIPAACVDVIGGKLVETAANGIRRYQTDTPINHRQSIRSDRTPDRRVTAIDAPYAKLARLRAENERNGRTHDKLKLELLPRLKRMMKEWKVSMCVPFQNR